VDGGGAGSDEALYDSIRKRSKGRYASADYAGIMLHGRPEVSPVRIPRKITRLEIYLPDVIRAKRSKYCDENSETEKGKHRKTLPS